jgi:hypothetical protein
VGPSTASVAGVSNGALLRVRGRDHGGGTSGSRLHAIVAGLPPLAHPSRDLTTADTAQETRLASSVAAALDCPNVLGGDTTLHLVVRLRLPSLVSALAAAGGGDPTVEPRAGGPTPGGVVGHTRSGSGCPLSSLCSSLWGVDPNYRTTSGGPHSRRCCAWGACDNPPRKISYYFLNQSTLVIKQ